MDTIYETAFRPPAPEILGRRLRPFSLGHSVLLDAGGSPFVDPAPTRRPNAGDLAAAVWVCSQDAGKLRFSLVGPDQKDVLRWGSKQRRAGVTIRDEIRAFVDYLTQSLRMPRAWEDPKARRVVAAWQFSVAASLIESGLTRAEVWDMPIAEALALYAAGNERKGLELVSPAEQAQIDALEQEPAS